VAVAHHRGAGEDLAPRRRPRRRGGFTMSAGAWARGRILVALAFLAWLDERGTTMGAATQADMQAHCAANDARSARSSGVSAPLNGAPRPRPGISSSRPAAGRGAASATRPASGRVTPPASTSQEPGIAARCACRCPSCPGPGGRQDARVALPSSVSTGTQGCPRSRLSSSAHVRAACRWLNEGHE